MLSKIRERTQETLLRDEFLCGEANFRTLAEAIACAIFISHGKRLHYVNHAAETITGYAREELLLMNFWDFVHPDFRELARDQERVRHGDVVVRAQHEVKIFTKSGEERWIDIRTGIVEFDGALNSIVSAFDLTEHKKAEVALVTSGVEMDVLGLAYEQFTDLERQAVVMAYPRGGDFKNAIIRAFYEGMKHRPDSTLGTVNDDVLAHFDPKFQRANFCSIILHSPWRG